MWQKVTWSALRASVALCVLAGGLRAQQPSAEVAGDLRASAAGEQRYRIGPGDLLDIRVFGHPEMGREARVDNGGRIRIPFMDEIRAACLTEVELSKVIEDKLKKYLRAPQVDVLIKDYQSQPVAVMGAVSHPGRFLLQRRVRLLELLALAGGANTNAGGSLNLIRGKDYDFCANPATAMATGSVDKTPGPSKDAAQAGAAGDDSEKLFDGSFVTINLHDLLGGTPSANAANIYIEPGDIITVPEADQVFLTGGVMRPGPIPLRQATTLLQAIGIAGGFYPDAAKKRIRILRQLPGSQERKEEIYDYEAIEKRKAKDVVLLANDLIEVPSSTAKSMGRGLLNLVVPTVGQLPLRVVRPY
ncbi:MAG: polysaccharide biosynthesis/export family protein [Acidobacteria bacterium]|nr:polysaccharide biosynthesis/export family protein [Acidobacteriota bacterium]